MKVAGLLIISLILFKCASIDKSQYQEITIRVNQVGYLTSGKKQAVVVNPSDDVFSLIDSLGNEVYEGKLLPSRHWDKSDETASVVDFTSFKQNGIYRIKCGLKTSHPFLINHNTYMELLKGSAKAYYYNRASTPLEEKYAGPYAWAAGHPDDQVMVHASASSQERSAGTKLATPFGWYDAGDYNKYIVNSGISTYTLMLSYEHNKSLFDTLKWNIPESKNMRPDLLDEIHWNLRWMVTMQDPEDGGVYNKTTTASFEGFVSPGDAKSQRYVVAKGTAAALNFAAVMARASALYETYNKELSDSYLASAESAWNWAVNNPNVAYKNPGNVGGDPAVSTGGYGDSKFDDEFFWAAVELFLVTGDSQYKEKIDFEQIPEFRVPNWNTVETLGLLSLVSCDQKLDEMLKKESIDQLMALSEDLMASWQSSPYRITLNQFAWGSNSDVLNQSMVLINAYRVFGKSEFYEAAVSGLDYVLGKNATGYCFVTGFGSLYPKNIHHRPSVADGVEGSIPGFLAGGPNPNNVDDDCGKDKYPSLLPAKCYIDDVCSYSTNEVTINWNAPLVYVIGSIQTLYLSDFI